MRSHARGSRTAGGGRWRARAALLGAAAVLAASSSSALAAEVDIGSPPDGPLTHVIISDQLNCNVSHIGDASPEFFGGTACGTFLAIDGSSLYGPASVPAGESATNQETAAWTPVSQSALQGSGTSASPYSVTTVVSDGAGVTVSETDLYIAGTESYRTDITIANDSGAAHDFVLYHAGDCFLEDSDSGLGSMPSAGAIACVSSQTGSQRIEEFLPLTHPSNYVEGGFDAVWADIGTKRPFPDACDCTADEDNGAGLSWSVTIPAGGRVTESLLTTFSPTGILPLTTTKTADAASVAAGGADGYTITITNPNITSATLTDISDTLPAGFSYVPGSTTGATAVDPSIDGQVLSWSTGATVPANGSVTLHFAVTASAVAGDYVNNAGGDAASGLTVAPSGPTAQVHVVGAGPPTASIATPADGATFAFGQGVNASYACAAGAGGTLQSCTGPVADGGSIDTGTAGVHSFTVTATDTDGQSATATSTYTVGAEPPPPPTSAPTVSSLAPTSGPAKGGTGVLILGSDLDGATAIRFGSTAGTVVSVNAAGTRLVAIAPPGSGTVDVTVTTPSGTSSTSAGDRYTYVPPPPTGGTTGGGTTGGTTGGGTTGGGTTGGGTTGGASTGGATTGGATTGGANGGGNSGNVTPGRPTLTTGPPKVISSTGAEFTAVINPRGLPTTMHFEYTAEVPGAGAAAITYDARTPEQVVGTDFADHTVTARVAGLLPSSRYHVRAVAANRSGVTPGADATFKTATDPPPAPPVLGKSFNAEPVSGVVYVLLPGTGHVSQAHASAAKGVGFIPLTEARQLPVGTIFDATAGIAKLTTAGARRGITQSGNFGSGLFKLLQNRKQKGLTELSLVLRASSLRKCSTATRSQAQAAAKKALPKTVLTLLRATAKGRFQTRGRYSSATVRGTSWTTSDRCDGTLTHVTRGVVVVNNIRRHRQIVLRAGKSYLAKKT